MTSHAPRSPAIAERVYAWALLAYPQRFRAVYARAMRHAFADRLAACRGAAERRRLLVAELADLVLHGARERLGALLGEQSPHERTIGMLESMWNELRHSVRALRSRPGVVLVAILVTALAIGSTTLIFTVVDGVLMRPMGYADPARLVIGWQSRPGDSLFNPSVSKPELQDYRSQSSSFESISAWGYSAMNVTAGGVPIPMWTTFVDAELFGTLGARMQLGRAFLPAEHTPGQDRVVILNGRVWQRRFGGDPTIVGTDLELDGEPYRVVGVMENDFQIPIDVKWPGRTGLILPLLAPTQEDSRESRIVYFVGRLRPGVTREQAQADLDTVTAGFLDRYPGQYPQDGSFRMQLVSLRDEVVGSVRPALLMLLAGVGLVMLIACTNVANLQLAGATRRQHEMAVRKSLGAGGLRLGRQLLLESMLVSILGGCLGLGAASFGLQRVLAQIPGNLPRLDEVQLDFRVVIFALALSTITGVAFGVWPALRAARADVMSVLRVSGAANLGRRRFGGLVVALEAAVAVVVLVAAGLLARSFWGLYFTDPGFDVDHTVVSRYQLDGSHAHPDDFTRIMQESADQLATLAGVERVGMVSNSPFWTTGGAQRIDAEGVEGDGQRLVTMLAGPGYFRAMSIGLTAGRTFEPDDDAAAAPVALLNEAAARLLWPGFEPVGRRLRLARAWAPAGQQTDVPGAWATVVGVVGDTLHNGVDRPPQPELYLPFAQVVPSGYGPVSWTNIMVRAVGRPGTVIPAVRADLEARFPDLPIRVFALRERFDDSLARPRFAAALMSAYALVAALIAAVGIYGVISYSVAQRVHEMGIRMAIGAGHHDVRRIVIVHWMSWVAVGIATGLGLAAMGARLVSTQLHEIGPGDPATYASVAAGLAAVALIACWLPARRATRIDLVAVIRGD